MQESTTSARPGAESVLAAYSGLHDSSLAVALAPVVSGAAQLNVLVPELSPEIFFAGMKTVAEAAALLSAAFDLPVRFIALHESGSEESYEATKQFLVETFDLTAERLTLTSRAGLIAQGFSSDDRWVATYWTTAHALDVASRFGIVDRDRVIYLVQDYEPGFFGWSSESAIAESTYHAGFRIAVNSVPLRDYLVTAEGIEVDPALVFAPNFDLEGMRAVAAARTERAKSAPTRIFFYGRPTKPRNLFRVGVAALRLAVTELAARGIAVEVISAGQPHDDLDLGSGVTMTSGGTLDWDGYCELLARVDVGLSLQKSAHPSHPPLEIAMSGAWAVTNDFSGTRAGLHPRLVVRPSDPASLAEGIVEAVVASRTSTDHGFAAPDLDRLGRDLPSVVARLVDGSPGS